MLLLGSRLFFGSSARKDYRCFSWTFIRFETNFVNAVAVGAVAGAGGVGYQLFLAGSFYLNIHEVGVIVYFCLSGCDCAGGIIATQLRKRFIVQN